MKVTPQPGGGFDCDYALDDEDMAAGRTVNFATGPIGGTFVLSDGSAYDVTPFAIAVKPEHLAELQLAIHKAHHAAGRFLDTPLPDADAAPA